MMETAVLDIGMTPSVGGQWASLHPMARARAKEEAFPFVLSAVKRSGIEKIETPCVVYADIYFKGRSQGGGTDFDNLVICTGKLFIDPLCPDKVFMRGKVPIHRVGLGLIPDDTVDHIMGIIVTRHPMAESNHTVLSFLPPGGLLRMKQEAASEKRKARRTERKREWL